jgi:hypothetical protein
MITERDGFNTFMLALAKDGLAESTTSTSKAINAV